MGAVLIRGIDDELKSKLRLRAAERGVSMEQELRTLHGVITELAHGRSAPGVCELPRSG